MERGFLFVEEKKMKLFKKRGGNTTVKKDMHFNRNFLRHSAKYILILTPVCKKRILNYYEM